MYRSIVCVFVLFYFNSSLTAQPKTDQYLSRILAGNTDAVFSKVLQHPETYRLQIIYTQINRDRHNIPHFKNYYFHYDSLLYFNPASVVKLPLAFLSLEKLNRLKMKGVTKYTPMQFDSTYTGQKVLFKDSTAANSFPSIAQFIKRAFLISENDPYNRMYQFVGQQAINSNLHQKGYRDIRITRQFMNFTPEQNRHTNAIRFIKENGTTLYYQPPAYNTDSFDFSHIIKLGKAYYNRNDSLIQEPFDFTMHNNLSLLDIQGLLQSVLFPASVPKQRRFQLTKDDYHFLYQYLSQYPSETSYPKYDTAVFYDSYAKFFFQDSTRHMPAQLRDFNKVGWSYGFLTDVSYVVDFKNKVEYMLSATVYVNSDSVLNDNRYDYENIGHPFLYQLGQTIYQYELKRKRKYPPDLCKWKLRYDHRNVMDKRPSLKDVDN